jgi:hypothetical protein
VVLSVDQQLEAARHREELPGRLAELTALREEALKMIERMNGFQTVQASKFTGLQDSQQHTASRDSNPQSRVEDLRERLTEAQAEQPRDEQVRTASPRIPLKRIA